MGPKISLPGSKAATARYWPLTSIYHTQLTTTTTSLLCSHIRKPCVPLQISVFFIPKFILMTFKHQGRSSKKFLIFGCSVPENLFARSAKGAYHNLNFGSYSYNISILTRTAKWTYYIFTNSIRLDGSHFDTQPRNRVMRVLKRTLTTLMNQENVLHCCK